LSWLLKEIPESLCRHGDDPAIMGEPGSNAMKYTRPKEKAIVEIGSEEKEDK